MSQEVPMILTHVLFTADLEIVRDVAEVLTGPADAATERANLVARALASLEASDLRRPR